MKKNTMITRVIGTVLAVVFVLSAIMTFSAIGASAATVTPAVQNSGTAHAVIAASSTNGGYDWWYPWNWKAPYHPVV